ncbi:MAG TPA: YidC/Oxa1 family membrane protein insertase [Actinomycetota bacterium]|nr:YidC/Oxa1 family membrane protein insertase [Actinomycetota bacterium]
MTLAQVPWSPLWQGLLNGLGWVLAQIYDLLPNFGLSIILLTVLIRLVLLPLGIKQIKSMQAMQAIQPKVRQVQQRFKANKQRQQEEIMKLYKEHGVNPFSGCWPVLLQFPILIAMYSIINVVAQRPLHLPEESALWQDIRSHIYEEEPNGSVRFLGMNLLCTAFQAGEGRTEAVRGGPENRPISLHCGEGALTRVPYYALAVLMIATTYFQTRQMQRASPPGQSQQQQMLTRVMPLMFGVFGFTFPAGLVLYWTASNLWQIGQQAFLLKAGHIGPQAWGGPAPTGAAPARGTSGSRGSGGRGAAEGSKDGDRKKRRKR